MNAAYCCCNEQKHSKQAKRVGFVLISKRAYNNQMNIYLDDVRQPKDTYPGNGVRCGHLVLDVLSDFDRAKWTTVRTFNDFVNTLLSNIDKIERISFDHDLGDHRGNWNSVFKRYHTGYDAVSLVEQLVFEGRMKAPSMKCHSANPVGVERILQVINKIEQSERWIE